MNIRFDEQQYQTDAVNSIVDIFEGQPIQVSNFTVSMGSIVGQQVTATGIGNKLDVPEDEIIENIQKIQIRNNLKPSDDLHGKNFMIEMETGTGKTYVYIRTIFELNKRYGFSKFVIVVPGVAVREGVYKSFQMTAEHFYDLYPGQHCHYFKYDSSKLEQVRTYATSTNIEVMIINIDAFRKSFEDPDKADKANLIHREIDRMNGKPIEFISDTNPIVIIDEPQSVDNTSKAKEAIASLNPLCILRYSATHRDTYNLMYKLDPVDAYEQRLVKRIEVLSILAEENFNKPYIKLLSVSNDGGYKAKVEMDEQKKNGTVKRVKREINPNSKDDLYALSGEREIYKGYILEGIDCLPGNESIEFENGVVLRVGEVCGEIDDDTVKRQQIRAAIQEHLDKERRLISKGIKVLTLFFIDKVANYRIYNEDGTWSKGKYAVMFEEEYNRLLEFPAYQSMLKEDAYWSTNQVGKIHGGYFSQDKNGRFKDSREKKDGSVTKDDESFFKLIMQEKEKLLSFDTPLRFIFSHSALKEGWDNPNVFQICTLVETNDTFTKRQKIGRGLRLAVNQNGERIYDENINVLTVIANESYEQFAEGLQKEMEQETGVKFGYVEDHAFSSITFVNEQEEEQALGYTHSKRIFEYLKSGGYINQKGKIEKTLKEEMAKGTFEVPEDYSHVKSQITQVIEKLMKKPPVFDGRDKVTIKLNKAVLLSDDFKQLWDRIKYKTTYSVRFDPEKLKKECIKAIQELPKIKVRRIRHEIADIEITDAGVQGEKQRVRVHEVAEEKHKLPDVLRYLQEQTNLKRSTLAEILIESRRLDDFLRNPQAFMEASAKVINSKKKLFIVDGIKYQKIGEHEVYTQELFESNELVGYIKANAIPLQNEKSVYDHIRYDSGKEKSFAEQMDLDDDVKLFVKLPPQFRVDTPLGFYNPDWAILLEKNGVEKLYFVVETKGSIEQNQLRFTEDGKIECGRKHFEALGADIQYEVARDYEEFKVGV